MKTRLAFLLLGLSAGKYAIAAPADAVVPTPPPSPTSATQTVREWPTFGFSLSLPPGWEISSTPPISRTYVTGLYKNSRGQVERAFKVEIGEGLKPTLKENASLVADQSKGKIIDTAAQLDGKPAVVVELHEPDFSLPEQLDIISQQGIKTFNIFVIAKTKPDLQSTRDTLLAGWKWQPFAKPWEHVEWRKDPFPIAEGRLSIPVPEIMRIHPDPQLGFLLAVDDHRTGISAFTLSAQVVQTPGHPQLRELRQNYEKILRARLGLSKPLTWTELRSAPARTICAPFSMSKEVAGEKYPVFVSYGLVKLSTDEWVLLTFTMTGQSEEARRSYVRTMDSMFTGIRLNDKASPSQK